MRKLLIDYRAGAIETSKAKVLYVERYNAKLYDVLDVCICARNATSVTRETLMPGAQTAILAVRLAVFLAL